jgi:hypothetical protein
MLNIWTGVERIRGQTLKGGRWGGRGQTRRGDPEGES